MPLLCRTALLFAAGCATSLFVHAVHGQAPSASEQAAYMAGIRIDRSMLAGPLASRPRSAMRLADPDGMGQVPDEVNLIGSGVVLEMPRVGPDGKFVRPRLMIGRRSPELRSWMMSMGLPPERCMLPTFRGRTQRDPDTGKFGVALMVSARCTFY